MGSRAVLAAAVILLSIAVPVLPQGSAGGSCTDPPGYFVGVVHDANQDPPRDDFQVDVDNFETFLETLRGAYCIPDDQATILAFRGDYTDDGRSYPAATEANVGDALRTFGSQAADQDDPHLFFFLSSHGIAYAERTCRQGIRAPGSLAALHGGDLLDCELGHQLSSSFDADTRMFVAVDCSLCGGFSDSLTAASGTVPDNSHPTSSGVPAPNRVVVTGCAITTECFGSSDGGVSYDHLEDVVTAGQTACDGWTAPGFPTVQGIDLPVRHELVHPRDGTCTASEWFFAAVWDTYQELDLVGIQEQYRIKYGFDSLADDITILD